MNILVWHGYLLSGTGSNVYIQNISREFCRRGHNVYLFTQDIEAFEYDFVNVRSVFNDDNSLIIDRNEKSSPYGGFCYSYQPNINGLLPVFVYDKYSGFIVKTFLELTDDELKNYVDKNVRAVKTLLRKVAIDIIIADHGVISPYIALQATVQKNTPFVVVLQGSDLEFTIKKSEKYLKLAYTGLKKASAVVAVTNHIYKEARTLFGEKVRQKIIKVPSGVNISVFSPIEAEVAESKLKKEVGRFVKNHNRGFDDQRDRKTVWALSLDQIKRINLTRIHDGYNDRHPDRRLLSYLSVVASASKLVVFIGKLMTTKGAHIAIASWPLVLKSHPEAVLVIVGFGELREALELMTAATASGDLKRLVKTADLIDGYLTGSPYLKSFYDSLIESGGIDSYFELSRDLDKKIIFTGLLYHEQTRYLLPISKTQLTISIFPEAFGLVVLEGAACGTVPIVTDHSGLHDVASELEKKSGVGDGYFRISLAHEKIFYDLSERVSAVLDLDYANYESLSKKIAAAAKKYFSWGAITAELEGHIEKIIIVNSGLGITGDQGGVGRQE